jgi:hypothetical protein
MEVEAVLRPQTTWHREAALWLLCLAVAAALVAPLIVQGLSAVEGELAKPGEEILRVSAARPIEVSSQVVHAGRASLDLAALAQANSIDEADNLRWALIRRTPIAVQVYREGKGVNWEALRGVSQSGTILLPAGFTWSFNETFKEGVGYKEAGGIIAGGHCALATVFRAAATQAGLPTESRPHATPIPGFPLDQTVNIYWGRDDLLVHNTTSQDFYFLWSVTPERVEVSLTGVTPEMPLPPLPLLENRTVAMVYGRAEPGGWGSLGLTTTADQALDLVRTYSERVDQWNGEKGIVSAINPNAAMKGQITKRETYLYYLIAEARRQGYYVMLDVQTGSRNPEELFNELMDKFLYENVWFNWDLEHTASETIPVKQINRIAEAYFTRRLEKGYSAPGIFAFYVFKVDQVANPEKIRHYYAGGLVVPIFDGFGGHGADPGQGKIAKTQRVLSLFGEGPYGIMEFETRWGDRFDQIGAREYFLAFPDALIMVSQ